MCVFVYISFSADVLWWSGKKVEHLFPLINMEASGELFTSGLQRSTNTPSAGLRNAPPPPGSPLWTRHICRNKKNKSKISSNMRVTFNRWSSSLCSRVHVMAGALQSISHHLLHAAPLTAAFHQQSVSLSFNSLDQQEPNHSRTKSECLQTDLKTLP